MGFGSTASAGRATQTRGVGLTAPDEARFLTSYSATFSRSGASLATPSPMRSAAQNALGQSAATTSSRSFRPPTVASFKLELPLNATGSFRAPTPMTPSDSVHLSRSSSESTLLRKEASRPSATLRPTQSRRVGKDARRKTLELLADPDSLNVAKEIFHAHDQSGDGELELPELLAVMNTLHRELDLPAPDEKCAITLFKKFDTNSTNSLGFPEFIELFKASLRRSAFDRSSMLNREFFVTKSADDVWKCYTKKKQLGSGSFGTAFLATRKDTGEERVVKAVKKSRTHLPIDEIEQEIIIMRQVDHPHVVRLFEWYEDTTKIYLVLEALKGGTLKEVLLLLQGKSKGLKEDWIRKVTLQSTEAMAYCHSLRLIHKDLKDENVMLLKKDPDFEEPFAVIIDLGIAEMFSVADPNGRMIGGTPMTMAPEVWNGTFGPKCDVFSLGVVLFEMLAGCYPFVATSMAASAWTSLHRRGPDWSKCKATPQAVSMCKAMLTYSDAERPTMAQCCGHEWYRLNRRELKTIAPTQFAPFAAFAHQQQVKRSLLLEIASQLPMDRAGTVVQLFEDLDVNSDGTISPAELQVLFTKMGIEDVDLVKQTFAALDADQDGSLTFTEFAAGALLLFKDRLEEALLLLFKKHDPNFDGLLDRAEAKDFLDNALHAMSFDGRQIDSEALVDRLMQGSPNGSISFEQVRAYLLGSNSRANTPAPSTRASSTRSSVRSWPRE